MLIPYIKFNSIQEIKNFWAMNAYPEREDEILGEYNNQPVIPKYTWDEENQIMWTEAVLSS